MSIALPTVPEQSFDPRPRHVDLIQASLDARSEIYANSARKDSSVSYKSYSSSSSPTQCSPSQATFESGWNEKYWPHGSSSTTDLCNDAPSRNGSGKRNTAMTQLRSFRNSIWASTDGEKIPTGADTVQIPISPTSTLDKTTNLSRTREYAFIFNVCLAQLFSLAALAQTFAPMMILAEDMEVRNPGQVSWYTAAYSLILGTFILPSGRLGDMFGHKKIFVIGWLWFSLWSLVCGFSYLGGPIMLSACRGMQGLGPALLIPNGIALIGSTFPIGMKRNVSIALFGGCGPLGVVVGAVFSSLCAQLLWWPWAFWFCAIACACAGVLSVLVIPARTSADATDSSQALPAKKESFDILGAFTGVGGLILINFAFNQAPLVGWAHPYVPTLLVVGLLLMAAFIHIELHVATRPIVPLRGLHTDAALTLACVAAGWASHGILIYYLFLLIENVRGYSALSACSFFWPVAPVGFAAALAVPFILKKIRVPILLSAAMFFFMSSTVLLATAPPDQTYWANTFICILTMPLAMNWSFPSGTILMSNAVSKKHQGIAASLITTMVNYSISTGLGIAGSIDRYVTPEKGLIHGYRAAWYLGIGFSAMGLIISFYFVWRSRPKT